MDVISPVQTQTFDRWRLVLPFAKGARLRDEEIVEITAKTLDQFLTAQKTPASTDWVNDPSAVHGRHLLTFVYGDQMRKFGGTYRGIHPIGVAEQNAEHRTTHRLDPVQRIGRIITGLHHDTGEDIITKKADLLPGINIRTARRDMMRMLVESWMGPESYKSTLVTDLRSLTDPFGLSTLRRHNHQIKQLLDGMTETGVVTRISDKSNNTETDLALVLAGIIADPEEIKARAQLARDKVRIVEAAPASIISAAEKEAYVAATEALELCAREAFKQAARKMTSGAPIAVIPTKAPTAIRYMQAVAG